jgi:hypothetical protein
LVELTENDESCYAKEISDIMSATECAWAAAQKGMTFVEVDTSDAKSANIPVGCTRTESTEDIYQWNPALRADEYELGDDPLRICLQSRRPTSPSDLRKYIPEYGDKRAEMVTYDFEDDELVSLGTALTCSDIWPRCELVPDVETCSNIADNEELRMIISTDPYIPGGCFYYDEEMIWNSGSNIAFPPLFSTAYYSHVCQNCRREDCPLPVWLWFVLVALGLVVCITSSCCCCYNYQTKTFRLNKGQRQLNPTEPGMQNPDFAYNFDDFRNNRQVNYPEPTEVYPTEGYPYRLSDSWDTPKVPMNLFNKPAS